MYTIDSGNKPSSVALHQNHAISLYRNTNKMPNICSKSQYTKNQCAEDPTINNSWKSIAEYFEYAL